MNKYAYVKVVQGLYGARTLPAPHHFKARSTGALMRRLRVVLVLMVACGGPADAPPPGNGQWTQWQADHARCRTKPVDAVMACLIEGDSK